MTTAVQERPAPTYGAFASSGPGAVLRLMFRLHRRTLWAVAALVAALGAAAGTLRLWERMTANERCSGATQEDCGLFEHGDAVQLLEMQGALHALFLLLWPALVAAFVAGPLIGRKLESGLHRFEWTQSLAPARWTGFELACVAGVTSTASLAVSALFRLAEHSRPDTGRWWIVGGFEGFGPVLLGHTLLAVAVGAFAGMVIRRGLPAMAAAGTFSLLLVGVLARVRWELWPTSTVTGRGVLSHDRTLRAMPDGSRYDTSGRVTSTGRHVATDHCMIGPPHGPYCPPGTRITGWYADYHPRSVFWWAQGTETLLLLALAAVLTYAAFRVLRRLAP